MEFTRSWTSKQLVLLFVFLLFVCLFVFFLFLCFLIFCWFLCFCSFFFALVLFCFSFALVLSKLFVSFVLFCFVFMVWQLYSCCLWCSFLVVYRYTEGIKQYWCLSLLSSFARKDNHLSRNGVSYRGLPFEPKPFLNAGPHAPATSKKVAFYDLRLFFLEEVFGPFMTLLRIIDT